MNDSDPAWLDTNLVVRYLTDDDAALAARAASIIEGDESLLWAEARSSGITTIYTFDQRFPSDGVDLRGLK